MNNREIFTNVIGLIIFLVGVTGVFNAFYFGRVQDIFWFCYIGSIMLGAGIIFKSVPLIKSQLYILIIPHLIWAIDFFTRLAIGRAPFGIVEYFFSETNLLVIIVSLQHLYILPLTIIAIWLMNKSIVTANKSSLISVIEITFIYLLTLIFTDSSTNINCVYRLCNDRSIYSSYYPLIWYASALIIVFFTRFVLNFLLKRLIKSDKD